MKSLAQQQQQSPRQFTWSGFTFNADGTLFAKQSEYFIVVSLRQDRENKTKDTNTAQGIREKNAFQPKFGVFVVVSALNLLICRLM